MRILVTGGGGQLADALVRGCGVSSASVSMVDCHAFSSKQLDITFRDQIDSALDDVQPDVVVNAAAYTAVDQAESDVERAMEVNGEAVGVLGASCLARGIRLVHISTDFVFSGESGSPYLPESNPSPLSVYGSSKLKGERRCLETMGDEALVIRSSWIYDSGHRNFVSTMLGLLASRSEIGVIADQVGTPTWADTLAKGVLLLAVKGERGIHHLTDSGTASWYDFASAIRELAMEFSLVADPAVVLPIRTVDYPTSAIRPPYSVMEKTKTFEALGSPSPHWRSSLRRCLERWQAPSF